MRALPVIVGFGGVNAAGRSTMHLGYLRMVEDALGKAVRDEMLSSLAALTGAKRSNFESDEAFHDHLLSNTLIRPIGVEHFDTTSAPGVKKVSICAGEQIEFVIKKRDLPSTIPDDWELLSTEGLNVRIRTTQVEALIPATRKLAVSAAGTVPTGFDPANEYTSRHHPRGLQLSTFAASDALQSIGVEWSQVMSRVAPDQVSVYSGSAMAQLDESGGGGLLRARWQGERPSSKQCPLSLVEMPADFVNAYLLGSVGLTGSAVGACASFLYNLRLAIEDISSGRARVAFVGNAEAPVNPEVIEGYCAMGALATDADVAKLDGLITPDLRKTSRPFGDNCGFTIAESSQYIVLMADDLAIELGATIYASVPGVFVNADGFKKSIAAPGMGNYLTMAKAVALAKSLCGDAAVKKRSLVQAHGSSTPANRVTESIIFNRVAEVFGINQWPITAVKSYLGHSLGAASGDQLVSTLGIWKYGIVPRINNVDQVADDVHQDRLNFLTEHRNTGVDGIDCVFINAKGFGGNNATGVVVSPTKTLALLKNRYGPSEFEQYRQKNNKVVLAQQVFRDKVIAGTSKTIYHFGKNVIDDDGVHFSSDSVQLKGFEKTVCLNVTHPFTDLSK